MAGFKSKKPRTGFNRPSAVAGEKVDRVWLPIQVRDLKEGDLIAGMGLVSVIFETCDPDEFYLEAGESVADFYPGSMQILAFVKKGQ